MQPTFTDQDRLSLLQLQLRQDICRRAAERSEPDQQNIDSPASTAIPGQWRLLPQEFALHDWQKRCLDIWVPRGSGTVKVATGGGKTVFAIAAAQKLQNERCHDLRVAIVVPSINLMLQWREEFQSSNLPASAIGLLGGGYRPETLDGLAILICVRDSAREFLPSLVSRAGWHDNLLLIVDECHRLAASAAQKVFLARPRFTLGLSATPETDTFDTPQADDDGEPEDDATADPEVVPSDRDYAESAVGKGLGPIIFDFTLRQCLEAGLLTQFEIRHVGLPLAPDEAAQHANLSRRITELRKELQAQRGRGNFFAWCQGQARKQTGLGARAGQFLSLASERKRLLYSAAARSLVTLAILREELLAPASRAIVFHEAIDQIETIFGTALAHGIPATLEHSKLPDSLRAESIELFRRGAARALISARSLVEGFNVPSADVGIIAASSGSVRQRIQSLGRMLRRKPGGGTAKIYVLYVEDTSDDTLYARADWEDIVGAGRNLYFRLPSIGDSPPDLSTLERRTAPPRPFRPDCGKVDVSAISIGAPYPGRVEGLRLRLDELDNLRDSSSERLWLPAETQRTTAFIREVLPQGLAAIATRCGHLVVRPGSDAGRDPDWRFAGTAKPAEWRPSWTSFDIVRRGSLLRIAKPVKGGKDFALQDETEQKLRSWLQKLGQESRKTINTLFWDGETGYWAEVACERIKHPEPLPALAFPT